MTRYVSEDGQRMLDDAPPLCAAAAYMIDKESSTPRDVTYYHVGIFEDKDRAIRWLAGSVTHAPMRIFVAGAPRKVGH